MKDKKIKIEKDDLDKIERTPEALEALAIKDEIDNNVYKLVCFINGVQNEV